MIIQLTKVYDDTEALRDELLCKENRVALGSHPGFAGSVSLPQNSSSLPRDLLAAPHIEVTKLRLPHKFRYNHYGFRGKRNAITRLF